MEPIIERMTCVDWLQSASNVAVEMEPIDKANLAFKKTINPEFDARGVASFKSMREAYLLYTGDNQFSGIYNPGNLTRLRAGTGFNSGSFAYGLQNALSMYLSKEYKRIPYHEDILISEKKAVRDFRKIHSVQAGYLGDLPIVTPETNDYQSVETYSDSESQYDLRHTGTILHVTRRHIMNDQIGLVKAMVGRMARSSKRTHARYVWNFFIDNQLSPDVTAWFTSAHGNLSADALGFTSLETAITSLANMEEPEPSEEKLGIDLASFNWHLVVPIALWSTAVNINQSDSYFTSNDLTTKTPNPCYRLFGDRNERIIVCPFMTDANDWGVIRDKEDVPIIEMSYFAGIEEPEFFVAQGPKEGQSFTADKIGYKIRHEYGGTLADHRGGYKALVA